MTNMIWVCSHFVVNESLSQILVRIKYFRTLRFRPPAVTSIFRIHENTDFVGSTPVLCPQRPALLPSMISQSSNWCVLVVVVLRIGAAIVVRNRSVRGWGSQVPTAPAEEASLCQGPPQEGPLSCSPVPSIPSHVLAMASKLTQRKSWAPTYALRCVFQTPCNRMSFNSLL